MNDERDAALARASSPMLYLSSNDKTTNAMNFDVPRDKIANSSRIFTDHDVICIIRLAQFNLRITDKI